MMPLHASFGRGARSLLPEARASGPMPWLIAVMMFLTVLAGAAGLALGDVARTIERADRVTIQLLDANPQQREAEATAALALLEAAPGVASARRVADEELGRLLDPWLGASAVAGDIPIPALVEAQLAPGADLAALSARVIAAAPSARVDADAAWLAPLGRLVASLRWLALGLICLAGAATAGTVVLAARAALDAHRETVEVLHLIGATDRQVAGLFTRRVAVDAAIGSALGFLAAAVVAWLIGSRLGALASGLVETTTLSPLHWAILAALPLLGVLLAMLVARMAILRALSRFL